MTLAAADHQKFNVLLEESLPWHSPVCCKSWLLKQSFVSTDDEVPQTDQKSSQSLSFKRKPALKPRLNCTLDWVCVCLSEAKRCCSKPILLFPCDSCTDSWMLPSFNKQTLCAISLSYHPVTLYGEDKSKQLKFKLLCALPWLPSFCVSLHLSQAHAWTASVSRQGYKMLQEMNNTQV